MAEYTLEPINDEPEYTLEPVETRQAPKSTLWGSINNVFPENTGAEAAKAANSLVYSDMLNIAPSVAYEYHDEIDRQVQDKLGKNRGVLQSAFESSIIGMMVRQKVPEPFESASQAERWIQGTLAMLFDIPTFMAGYVIGGGNPISGTAGAFGFHSGLRKILMDRYSKGEARDALEWFERTGNAIKETIKGEVIGGFVGGVGYMAPVWGGAAMRPLPSQAWKGLLELSTMTTAGKLVEGQLPTTQDLIDNAGILLAMHAGIKGVEAAKSRIPEVRRKLQEVYVETGVHPKEIKDTIINERLNPQEDVIDTIDRVAQDIKKDLPPEPPQPPEKPSVATVPEKPIPSIKEPEKVAPEPIMEARGAKESPLETTTSIKNAAVDAERKAAGLEPIESPVNKRSMPETMEEVRAKVDSGEIKPRELARKINNIVELGERPEQYNNVTTKDALLYDKVRIENEQRGITDKYENPESMRRWLELQEAYDANQRATKALASEWGYTGLAMQQEMHSDYSLSAMIRRAKEDGVDTTNPEVIKKYEKLSSEIEKAQASLGKVSETTASALVEKTVKQLVNEEALSQRKQSRRRTTETMDAEFDALVKKFNKTIGGQLNVGIDPAGVKILVDMARNRISKGIVKAEDIIDSIHTALVNAGIELSKRDIRDAISNYGKTKEMSKEEVNVALREAKRQMQLISAYEDAKAGELPKKSGLQRDQVSDRVRELQREVREAIRESGLDVMTRTPEQQWRTAMDAVKTRLRNQIKDLEKQIKTGEKKPPKKGIEYDAEAKALVERRDALKKLIIEIEGKPEMTPEQRIRNATAAVQKSIAEYERRIKEGDLSPQKKKSKTPETPELKELRERRDALKETLDEMKEAANPKKSPEEIAIEQFLKRKERQIAEYERRLQEGDFSKQTREPRELSQEELDAQFKVDQKKREYEKARLQDMLAQRGTKKVVTDSIVEAMLLVKAIKSAYDVSAPGRQGFFALISHPILGFKNIAEMFRALRSEEVVYRIHKEIQGRKNAKLYKEAEVPFTDTEGKIATAEEMFMGRWQEYIPGIPASNRAFVAFLNLMRADLFDAMYKYSFERRGVKATKEELLALGDYVAQATGRGTIKKYESALQEAGKVLWAPKLVVSRFQMLTGKGLLYGRGTAATRKAVAREYARILGGLAIIYSVDYLVNTTPVETDPTSSDFGKIIAGKTRIDVLAGVSQATVLLGRLGYGESKNIRTGRITPIRGENIPYGGQDSWDVMMRFMRTKLTPVLGIAINLATEKDLIGKKYGWEDVPADLTVPLAMRDIYEAMQEEGIPAGLALGTLGMFGVGLQTHEDKRFSR